MDKSQVEILVHPSIRDIRADDWDRCACPEVSDGQIPRDPFTTHAFLSALESSGSVGPGTGWSPRPISARAKDGLIAVAPLFVKAHSQGEYVFDHGWANAYEHAGGAYYPKLQIAVPFTPVTGRRLLTRPGFETVGQAALVEGAVQLASQNRISSLHITFCTEEEVAAGTAMGLMHRTGQQFHWTNQGYGTFEDFLGALSSRKRKAIRRERKGAQEFGGDIIALTGDDIRPEHWDAFWQFYQSTGARKWGSPYLTRAFFDILHTELRDLVLLVLAVRDGQPVAGALNMIGRDALFGRYWGCIEHHPFLHFELCYYQAIDFAIAHGLARVEAGAQGEHKIARGYLPVATHSLHWIGDPGFRKAIDQYLQDERAAVAEGNEYLAELGPFKRGE